MEKKKILYGVGMGLAVAVAITCGTVALVTSSSALKKHVRASDITPAVGNYSQNMVLLISLDGFRASYLQRGLSPTIQSLIDSGASPPYMYPSFPSVTFPNHYTIATGLYPESHGIINNYMYDPTVTPPEDQIFDLGAQSSFNPQWWGGEPIWRTVQKASYGNKAATFFWPGAEVPIKGAQPNFWWPYDPELPFDDRVDTVVELMKLPESCRPKFYTLYFFQPDHFGHLYGPDSDEVNGQIKRVDAAIKRLLDKLEENHIRQYLNIIIVSDHGMQAVYQNQTVNHLYMEDYLDPTGLFVADGAIAQIRISPESNLTVTELHDSLTCAKPGFQVFTRDSVPRRWHCRKTNRLGDLMVVPDPGNIVHAIHNDNFTQLGEHGYDMRAETMHAIFLANGPDIKKNTRIEPFENIEIYEFISDLLKIDPELRAPNNGTRGLLWPLMVNPPNATQPPMYPIDTCVPQKNATCDFGGNGTHECRVYAEFCDDDTPTLVAPSDAVAFNRTTCELRQCRTVTGWDYDLRYPRYVQTLVNSTSNVEFGQTAATCAQVPIDCDECNDLQQAAIQLQDYNLTFVNLAMYSAVWSRLTSYAISQAANHTNMLLFAGPAFDYDRDGVFDGVDQIQNQLVISSIAGIPIPSDLYLILMACENGVDVWCSKPKALSFVIPNMAVRENACMNIDDYIFDNTARVRDIEELTELTFVQGMGGIDFYDAIQMRTHINLNIW